MTEDEFNDLIERVHQVEQVAATFAWQLLRDRAMLDMAKAQAAILGGTLDHEKYLTETGRYAGMAHVLALPELMRRELDVARAVYAEELELEEEEAVEA